MPKQDSGDKNESRIKPFLITISYFISFLFIRIAVIISGSAGAAASVAAKEGEISFYIGTNVILFGYHIHHFYFGVILICIAGWVGIVGSKYFNRKHAALMYGAGLGLFMDEIGLLLTWGDYWSSLSYILSLFIGGIFLNIVYFPSFWREVRKNLKKQTYSHWMFKRIFSNEKVVETADEISEKTSKTERVSLVFIGILFIIIGILVLMYPDLVYYLVVVGFLMQGISNLVRAREY